MKSHPRNSPCPCGSQDKYKNCCWKHTVRDAHAIQIAQLRASAQEKIRKQLEEKPLANYETKRPVTVSRRSPLLTASLITAVAMMGMRR